MYGVLFAVIVVGVLCAQIPGFQWSWTRLLGDNGGKLVLQPVTSSQTPTWIAAPCLLALALGLPYLAYFEETIFRARRLRAREICEQSVRFGLMHFLGGVPLAGCCGLMVLGVFLGLKYRRAWFAALDRGETPARPALLTATAYHTMHNGIVFAFIGYLVLSRSSSGLMSRPPPKITPVQLRALVAIAESPVHGYTSAKFGVVRRLLDRGLIEEKTGDFRYAGGSSSLAYFLTPAGLSAVISFAPITEAELVAHLKATSPALARRWAAWRRLARGALAAA